jgi:hypothetical protein
MYLPFRAGGFRGRREEPLFRADLGSQNSRVGGEVDLERKPQPIECSLRFWIANSEVRRIAKTIASCLAKPLRETREADAADRIVGHRAIAADVACRQNPGQRAVTPEEPSTRPVDRRWSECAGKYLGRQHLVRGAESGKGIQPTRRQHLAARHDDDASLRQVEVLQRRQRFGQHPSPFSEIRRPQRKAPVGRLDAEAFESMSDHVGKQEVTEVEAVKCTHHRHHRFHDDDLSSANGASTNRCASADCTTSDNVTRINQAQAVPTMP